MGKAVLIFLLGSMAIFGVINLFNNSNNKNALNTAISHYSNTQVRNIGNSTMQMILSQLADNSSWRVSTPQSINLLNGTAQYTIETTYFAGDSLVKINVVANYRGTQKTIIAYFKPPQIIPPYLNYALLSGKNLTTASISKLNITSSLGGNANVFANGNCSLWGPKPKIAGFLNYTGNVEYFGTSSYLSQVNPPSNPNGLPAYGKVSAGVPIPTIDQNYIQSIATKKTKGDTSIGSIFSGGTVKLSSSKTNPTILYVNGDLNLTNVTFTGYGAVCVKGNLTLVGNNVDQTIDSQGSPLAMYVMGDANVWFGGFTFNLTTMGQFFALGIGDLSINGSLISKNDLDIINLLNVNISYNPPVPSIAQPFGGSPTANRPSDVRYYLE